MPVTGTGTGTFYQHADIGTGTKFLKVPVTGTGTGTFYQYADIGTGTKLVEGAGKRHRHRHLFKSAGNRHLCADIGTGTGTNTLNRYRHRRFGVWSLYPQNDIVTQTIEFLVLNSICRLKGVPSEGENCVRRRLVEFLVFLFNSVYWKKSAPFNGVNRVRNMDYSQVSLHV